MDQATERTPKSPNNCRSDGRIHAARTGGVLDKKLRGREIFWAGERAIQRLQVSSAALPTACSHRLNPP
jgi:hypothetical protein